MAKGKYLDLYDEIECKDRKYIAVTGRLSMSLPALDKSPRGKYVSPILKSDQPGNKGHLCSWFNNSDGTPKKLYTLKDGEEKEWEQEKLVGEKVYPRYLCVVVNRGEEKPDFIPLILWGQTAVYVHRYCSKGDRVVLTGYWSTIKLSSTAEEIQAITVRKIKKISSKSHKADTIDPTGDPTGFVHDEEDDDELPF